MSSTGGLPDQFLLDLFREEVRANVQTLNEGLVGLEQTPDDSRLIEPLMRAAHSIKGAARVVAVDAGVRLAHSMEELLVTAQKSQVRLTSNHVDLLLRGVDLLGQIGTAIGPAFDEWDQSHTAELNAVIQQLDDASVGKTVVAAPQASEVSKTSNVPTAESPRPPKRKRSNPKTNSATESESTPTAQVAPAADLAESPMLDLFRNEMRTQSRVLREGLDDLERDPANAQHLERLFLAARSAKSAAFLVNVPAASQLARAVEQLVQTARDGRVRISREIIGALREAAGLLDIISVAVGPNYSRWQADHEVRLASVIGQLRNAAQVRTKATPASSPAVAQPEPAAAASKRSRPSAFVGQTARQPAVTPAASTSPASADDASERVVRVTAQNLTRLMGLAGESLVEARWLPVFANSLFKLKKQQSQATDLLDDIWHLLPDIEAATPARMMLNELRQRLVGCQAELANRIGEFETHARQSDDLNSRLYNEVIASRMRPLSDGVHGFPRMVRDLARQLGKRVQFDIAGQTTPVDRDILEKLEAPLNHILRNALDHGMETPEERVAAGKPEVGQLRLIARHSAGMFSLSISDDGRGIDIERLRSKIVERGLTNQETASRLSEAELLEFLFLPGFSTREKVTDVSGRGVGLDVVHSMVHSVGGTVRIQTQAGRGTTIHLQLPITLSVIRAVLVKIGGEPYAFPHNRIDRLFRLPRESIASLEHRQFCNVDGKNVGMVMSRQVFQLHDETPPTAAPAVAPGHHRHEASADDGLYVVLFSNHNDQFGLVVDEFCGEQDLVVRPLDLRLGKVPNVQAAAILDDGSPILIVDLDDLRISIERLLKTGKLQRTDRHGEASSGRQRRVLIVDDSITVREVERQLLSNRGYLVEVAVDGAEGWNRVRQDQFDLVISDIDMPRMDGFEFVRLIKSDPRLQSTPVVIVSYKDRDEDRQRGLEVGANYYLTKSSFHDESLLNAVEDLIGGPVS